MRRISRVDLVWVMVICSVAICSAPAQNNTTTNTDAAKTWVCPPCGLPCDSVVYSSPGTCPRCGMALIEKSAAEAEALSAKKVAMLVFNGVEIIDYTGPWEVFGAAGFDVYSVAESKDPVTTAMGMKVLPSYTFADAPVPDVLLVPGGGVQGALKSVPTLKWVAEVSAHAGRTISVCNGAFILAKAGLLDGLTATTTCHLIDNLRSNFPKVNVVNDQRYVDNGKIITTAGLSAGIDGALHVVAELLGTGEAERTALSLEYDWKPEGTYARAALADQYLPEFTGFEATMLSTTGDRNSWELRALVSSPHSVEEITRLTAEELVSRARHTNSTVNVSRLTPVGLSDHSRIEWKFTDDKGRPWEGTGTVEEDVHEKGKFVADLKIALVK